MLTPQQCLREYVAIVLGRRGGSGRRAEVLTGIEEVFGDMFTTCDREPVESRPFEAKWRNRASYERAQMIRESLLVDRADGVWELDIAGWSLYRSI